MTDATPGPSDRKRGWLRTVVDIVSGRRPGEKRPWPARMHTSSRRREAEAESYVFGRYRGTIDVIVVSRIVAQRNDFGTYDLVVEITEPQEETQYKRRGLSGDDVVGTLLLNEISAARKDGGIRDIDAWLAETAPRQKRGHILRELHDRGLLQSELADLRRSGDVEPRRDPLAPITPGR